MAWTDLSFPFGSTLTSAQMTNLYNNFQSMANGEVGAPPLALRQFKAVQISDASLGTSYATYGRINMDVRSGSQIILLANVEADMDYSASNLLVITELLGEAVAGTLMENDASSRILSSTAYATNQTMTISAVHSATASQVYSYYYQAKENTSNTNTIDGHMFIALEMGNPDGL